MKIENVALILRRQENGQLLIVGSAFDVPIEIKDDEEYLFIGNIEIIPRHTFHEYMKDKGNTPDRLIMNGGLDWKNYKNKIQ